MDRIAAAIIGLAVSTLWWVNPETASWLPQCPLHAWTGLYCPGCGSTRAVYQLIHGHFLAALRFNAMFVIALPIAALLIFRKQMKAPWLWLTAIAVFGILRNLPWSPFTMLSPNFN